MASPDAIARGHSFGQAQVQDLPLSYFHIDIAEVQTAEGRLYLLVAIDRVTKFVYVELHEKATRRIAADFLRALINAVPYAIHTVLTDNSTHSPHLGTPAPPRQSRHAVDCGELFPAHTFGFACVQNHIDHRLTKPSTVDQRSGRTHEQHDQGSSRQALPL